jgi:hypothetical protein
MITVVISIDATFAQDIELRAAALEADQANRDFMIAWLDSDSSMGLNDPYIAALRHYREAAEGVVERMLHSLTTMISTDNGVWFEVRTRRAGDTGPWETLMDFDHAEDAEAYAAGQRSEYPGWDFYVRRQRSGEPL